MSLWVLFKVNLKMIIRNRSGLFWTVVMPVGIYVALSVLPIEDMAGVNIRYSTYLLPGMIAMTIMQAGIYSLAYWMVDLKARGVIKRLQVTPLRKNELIFSLLLARVVVMMVQVVLLTLVGVIFFEAVFVGNLEFIFLFTVLGGFIFLLIGLLISTVADSYESAAPITAAIGLPFSFLGNIFFPVENLPGFLQIIAKLFPITYLAEGLRAVYLGQPVLGLVGKDLLILSLWFVVLFALVVNKFKFQE